MTKITINEQEKFEKICKAFNDNHFTVNNGAILGSCGVDDSVDLDDAAIDFSETTDEGEIEYSFTKEEILNSRFRDGNLIINQNRETLTITFFKLEKVSL